MPNEISTHVGASFVAPTSGAGGLLANAERFEFGWRAAGLFAASQLVPPHLRGKREDCFIAIHMAERLNEDPLVVLQNIHVVSGRAGWSAQYMIGRANRSGVFKGRIGWRVTGQGEALSVVAFATLAETGDVVESPTIDMKMAKAEGWTKNPKYQSMPEVMLRYRAATFLIRFNCPEVMLGIPTSDEVEDTIHSGEIAADAPPRPARPDQTVIEGPKEAKPPKAPKKDEPRSTISLTDADGQVVDYAIPGDAKTFEADFIAQMSMAAAVGAEALAGLLESNAKALEQLRADGWVEMLAIYDTIAEKAETLGGPKLPAADAPTQGTLY